MAATLGRMERDGVIERKPDPDDKRSARFSLTPATRDTIPAIEAVIESMSEESLAPLGEAERARFRHMLELVTGALEKALDDQG